MSEVDHFLIKLSHYIDPSRSLSIQGLNHLDAKEQLSLLISFNLSKR